MGLTFPSYSLAIKTINVRSFDLFLNLKAKFFFNFIKNLKAKMNNSVK